MAPVTYAIVRVILAAVALHGKDVVDGHAAGRAGLCTHCGNLVRAVDVRQILGTGGIDGVHLVQHNKGAEV